MNRRATGIMTTQRRKSPPGSANTKSHSSDQGLRARAESLLSAKTARLGDVAALTTDEAQRLVHELQVHQAELEIQNEDLIEAQAELERARDRYYDLYDNAPIGYLTLSRGGVIQAANVAAGSLLGRAPQDLVNRLFVGFVSPEDRKTISAHWYQVAQTGCKQTVELPLQPAHGAAIIARLETAPHYDDTGAISSYRTAVIDITARKDAEDRLKETASQLKVALAEREVLLQELHHRVKNNLAMIGSFITLHEHHAEGASIHDILEAIRARVLAMASAHEMLYRSDNLASLDASAYLNTLIKDLRLSADMAGSHIRIQTVVDDTHLDLQTAVTVGLLVTELVSNALKHAFPDGREGCVQMTLHSADNNRVALTVSDDGVGMPDHVDPSAPATLGLDLVHAFADQLRGTLTIEKQPGTTVRIIFPVGERCDNGRSPKETVVSPR